MATLNKNSRPETIDRSYLLKTACQPASDPLNIPLIVYWGCHGIGKSTLLSQISPLLNEYYQFHFIGSWDLRTESSETVIKQIKSAWKSLPKGSHGYLLLDNIDHLLLLENGNKFFEFEKEIVQPAVESQDLLIVATSLSELRQWRIFEIRVQQKNLHIPMLTNNEIETYERENQIGSEKLSDKIAKFPYVLRLMKDNPSLDINEIADLTMQLLNKQLSHHTKEILTTVCLLPVFNTYTLQLGEQNDTDSDGSFEHMEAVSELIRDGLIYWETTTGYRFVDGSIRRLLSRNVWQRNPAKCKHLHVQAADYYTKEARRSAYMHLSLVSAVYHLAYASIVEKRDPTERCLEWVSSCHDVWIGANWDAAILAWNSGLGDADLVQEIQTLIGTQTYVQIGTMLAEMQKLEIAQ